MLSNPDELAGSIDYDKGSLVLAALETLLAAVRTVGGPEIAATAEQYITTSTTVNYRPSTEQLEEVYGYGSPAIQKDVKTISAVGQNWTRSLDSEGQYLGPTERLRVTVRVTNNGNVEGTVAVAPRIAAREGEFDRFDETWVGRVTPGESVTRTVTQRFGQPGTYELEGTAAGRVTVVPDRGSASVTELETIENQTSSENVTVQITVQNDANRRTFISEPVVVDGRQVSTVALVLGPGATETVIRSVPASNGSPRNITVGTVSTVDEESGPGESSGAGSQFESVLALAVVAFVVGIAALVLWVAVRRG